MRPPNARRSGSVVATERLGGFTLFEVVLSMGILALLAASVYAVVSSAIGASSAAMDQQLALRRIDAFLRVTRDAFLNLPAEGTVTLEIGKASGGEAEQRLVIGKAQHIFGIPSLAGGTLVLAARPRSDGTRTITMLRIPPNAQERDREKVMGSAGVPLLPKARKPRWSFFQNGAWTEEWPAGSPRPLLVRLQMEMDAIPDGVEAIFYVPPVSPPPAATPPGQGTSPAPSPSSSPPATASPTP